MVETTIKTPEELAKKAKEKEKQKLYRQKTSTIHARVAVAVLEDGVRAVYILCFYLFIFFNAFLYFFIDYLFSFYIFQSSSF